MKTNVFLLLGAILLTAGIGIAAKNKQHSETVVVAYVNRVREMPDPHVMTHINYAFGQVNKSFNGVDINSESDLRTLASLKKQNKKLKVLLSVGGWGSGRFSEMAADETLRLSFAADCKRIVKEFNLDGIDIDWEYPTSNSAGISSSPDDTDNYTLLMRDIRSAIGKKKLLTLASVHNARFIDFQAILPYIDFVNIMSYDMGRIPHFHCALYHSDVAGRNSMDDAVKAHLDAGIPPTMLVAGIPLYGRGGKGMPDYCNYSRIEELIEKGEFRECWNDTTKTPYIADDNGRPVMSYDNPRSVELKCQYITDHGLLGAMYWEYNCDTKTGTLRNIIAERLLQ